MDEEQTESLRNMYKLFARVDGQKVLQASFKIYVQVRRLPRAIPPHHTDTMGRRNASRAS